MINHKDNIFLSKVFHKKMTSSKKKKPTVSTFSHEGMTTSVNCHVSFLDKLLYSIQVEGKFPKEEETDTVS